MLQSFQGGGDVNCAYGVGGGFKKVERRVSELFFFFAGVEEYRTIVFRGIYYNLMLIIGYLRSSYFYHLFNFWSVANVAIFN